MARITLKIKSVDYCVKVKKIKIKKTKGANGN